MARQIQRRLRGQKLRPYQYHDFGSLVSLGRWSTVGNLMGFCWSELLVEGLFAQTMYARCGHARPGAGWHRAGVLGIVAAPWRVAPAPR